MLVIRRLTCSALLPSTPNPIYWPWPPACAARQTLSPAEVGLIAVPLLVAVGSEDRIAGSPLELAALIPGAQALVIPGRDHMLAVGDKVFKNGVLEFLAKRVMTGPLT